MKLITEEYCLFKGNPAIFRIWTTTYSFTDWILFGGVAVGVLAWIAGGVFILFPHLGGCG